MSEFSQAEWDDHQFRQQVLSANSLPILQLAEVNANRGAKTEGEAIIGAYVQAWVQGLREKA